MGWFSSNKKEEDFLSSVPTLQQVSNSDLQNKPIEKSSFEVTPVSQEVGANCRINKSEPFFVRVDKFNEAKRSLIEIEKKMKDMEVVLNKLGEVKQKEDEEIDSWKQDMKIIKGYLEDINDSVFNRL